ncbi:MAG: methyltransferase, partial [Bacteroidales bacterium]|nr:methyltransferase [Bacteroidales bacterium]
DRLHYYDFVFIDANKREYSRYYDLVFPLVKVGGIIVADDVLWDGKVLEEIPSKDAQTQGLLHFNDMVAEDRRVEKVMIPLRDGLTIIVKKSD